jgi:sRNA-binding carbon storage regulator CsrA
VLLELNLSLLNQYYFSDKLLEQIRLMLKLTKKNNKKIVISSDCHIASRLGDDLILNRLGINIPSELILGSEKGYQEIQDFLKLKK